ncbi:hypothetical protein [Burkholderia anthina]|uniref:hypothetical protein n=1 Tax=Burkholderia anthina TaxID=179879 RepID=UPI00158F0B7C|nr:hypothetical protein [Burkholderia anthina]
MNTERQSFVRWHARPCMNAFAIRRFKESVAKPAVCVGHRHGAPLHGVNSVTSEADPLDINVGPPDSAIASRPVACLANITRHGDTLIEGETG